MKNVARGAMLKLFPGPDREKRMRGDKADNLGVTQSQQQARLAGLALVFLNAALAAVGMVFVIHGFGSMNQNFHTWHAASILDLGLAFLLFAAGAWMVFEAFWPWLLRIPPEASWSHAWVDDGAGDPKAMVSQWCREVGYAVPVILELTWEANAGLDLQAALRGEIRIRLGMPLFLGLEKVQLRAVVMHELGHFGQRAYLGSVLRHQELGRRIAIGALFRGHPMWRGLSKAWPWVQQLGQNWMHALEVEADEFARTHCGETELVTAMLRLKVLEQSIAQAMRTVQSAMASGVLPDDLSALFLQETAALQKPISQSLKRRAMDAPASVTHPALKARVGKGAEITTVETANPKPHVPAWLPTEAQSKEITEAYYEHELGKEKTSLGRVSVGDARCRLTRTQDAHSALEHYFLGLVREAAPIRPLPQLLNQEGEWLGAMNAKARLPIIRATLKERNDNWLRQRDRWEEANFTCRSVAAGDSDRIGVDSQAILMDWLVKKEAAASDLRNATEQLSQRLTFGLLLLDHPDVYSVWPEARLWRRVAVAWREELPLLAKLLSFLEEVTFDIARLNGLERMSASRKRVCEVDAKKQIWQALSKAVHALERQSLSDPSLSQSVSEIFEKLGSTEPQAMVEKLEQLYSRLSQAYLQGLGDLAYAAGKAELAAGIKPWE